MKKLLLLTCFLLSVQTNWSQTNIDFGVNGGLALYSGDLSPQPIGFSFEDLGPAAGVFLRTQFKDWVGLRTSFTAAYLNADDRRNGNFFRGVNFRTYILEFSGILEISPFNLGYYSSNTVVVPYVAVGAGAFYFNPRTQFRGEIINLQPLGTEGQGLPGYGQRYSRVSLAFPFGIGIKFVHKDRITYGFDILGRKIQTDYLDDVSGTLINYGDLFQKDPDLARISAPTFNADDSQNVSYRRGGFFNDWYYIASIHVAYRIQAGSVIYKPGKKGVVCPRF